MSAEQYLSAAKATLQKLADTQREPIRQAAGLMVQAIIDGHSIFSFGASHSFMITEELVYRTGGLMLVNPIYPHGMNLSVRPATLTSKLERVPGFGRELLDASPAREGDVLLITSTSGRNAVTIDMAIRAREKKINTIGITALAYVNAVASRHPSGKKLPELCDLVIDNCVPYGDAVVEVPGFPQKVGPLSSLTGLAIANALVAEVVAGLVVRGITPPVFISANVDGGDQHNERLLAQYRDRIHYL
jgi:uncharacterized phosphosugar-binding protein